MKAGTLLDDLRRRGIEVWADGDRLRYRGPKGVVTPTLRAELAAQKADILEFLFKNNATAVAIPPPLLPVSRDGELPLSFAQQRLWFLDQLVPDSFFYNIPVAVRLTGPLDLSALSLSLNEVVRRHEPLRTFFATVDGRPVQVISPNAAVTLLEMSLVDRGEQEREAEAVRLAQIEAQRPFDLARGPLLRTTLFRLGEQDHIVLLTMHHIVADIWSIGVLVREMAVLYGAFSRGNPSRLPGLPIQYADFAIWQRNWLQGEVLEEHVSYWKKQLGGSLPILELPLDHPRPAIVTFRGARQPLALSRNVSEALEALSRREGVTVFMTLLAALKTLLYRYTGEDDIIVGSPIAGREQTETEGLIGFFANTLVLRTNLSGNPTFRELLGRVRKVALGAYTHQALPFEKLVEELQPDRNLSHNPLFQVAFTYQNAQMPSLTLAGLTLNLLTIDLKSSKFDLELYISEGPNGLDGWLEYNTDLFDADTVKRMAIHFQTLLEGLTGHPEQPISELPLLAEAERHQLLVEWNRTEAEYPQDACVHQLFEAQVERSPKAIAVAYDNERLSYLELNERANQLAHHLRGLGVTRETRVAICVERSLEMLVGLLGILKAGGAYVPLDPMYPKERLAFMLEDGQAQVLLTQKRLRESLPGYGGPVVYLDRGWEGHVPTSKENPASITKSDTLAYVIYTSGSTGLPKGVQVEHRALVNLLHAMQQHLGLSGKDVLLAVTTLSFDIAGLELFLPLLAGAQLIVASREVTMEGTALAEMLSASGATLMQATPATWRLLVDVGWQGSQSLKVLCGGEALSSDLAVQLQPRGECLWNLYGPTETTIWSAVNRVDAEEARIGDAAVAIGRPIANTQIYVLDRMGQPVPIGVAGELHIGGAGLARGYLNRPELTAEKFIVNPFTVGPGARLYKTGDRACYRTDGKIKYLGRSDNQVKLRGHRIELGEIEAVLSGLWAVHEAVVLAREDVPGDKRIVAYVVASQEAPLKTSELSSFLKQKLPEYMIPSAFVLLDALPLTPNGKVDRRALPAPDQARPQLEEAFVAPRSPIEEAVAGIWSHVLGLERIGIHDSFFELGGHSLLATQIVSALRKTFQVELPLRSLFETPTVAGLAAAIQESKAGKGDNEEVVAALPEIIPDPENRYLPFPLTDVQQAYWIGRQGSFALGDVACHIYLELESTDLNLERFELAWQQLIERHEMLRAIVLPGGQQQILEHVPPYRIEHLDLREHQPEDRASQLEAVRARMSHQVLPPERWPLFEIRASLLDDKRTRLHISFDLLIGDAWSFQILFREFSQTYGEAGTLPPAPELSFRDYVLAEIALQNTALYRRSLDYWQQRVPILPPAPELPLATNPSSLGSSRFTRRSARLEPPMWQELKRRATQAGLTPSVALLAAFAEVLTCWSKSPRFTINLTLFNRLPLHPEVNDIVGDFTTLTMLVVDNSSAGTFEDRARHLQQQLWDDLDHSYVSGVRVLRELMRTRGEAPQAVMPVVFTSALNQAQKTQNASTFGGLGEVVYGISQTPQVWLDQQVYEEGDALAFVWDAVEELFPQGLLDDMFGAYCDLLQRLVDEKAWQESSFQLVPAEQLAQRGAVNATETPLPAEELLHMLVAKQVTERPSQVAIVAPDRTLNYEELFRLSNQVGHRLRRLGARPNRLVAVVMEKGWEQVVAVLGVLQSGAAYLPIDANLPRERLWYLLEHGEVELVLTQSWLDENLEWPDCVQRLCVSDLALEGVDDKPLEPVQTSGDLAYVIYTSGSTGLPKGVMIDHRGAVNTILDINRRFGVDADDKVLALSSLSFDLSVYDIFGTLAAGGTVVLPEAWATRDPSRWAELMVREKITIWNSVPALIEILIEYLVGSSETLSDHLRLVLLSGDWIPVTLPGQIKSSVKDVRVIGLGGATEASIWSILYPIEDVDSKWKSIPYGFPMANQRFHVLNEALEPCPVWVTGQLYIGGVGLAQGYWREEEKTSSSFFAHPRTGERLYRTGDMGRYLPDGNIEFLGREDLQVKVQGHRIELGEIEAALAQHPGVRLGAVTALGPPRGNKRLVAHVVPRDTQPPGIDELREFLQTKLPEYMVPSTFALLDALPLSSNGKVDRQALASLDLAPPDLGEGFEPPRTPLEKTLAEIWGQVLGVERVGIHDNFFDLGGDSLRAIQVMMRLQQAGVEEDIQQLFASNPQQLFKYQTIAQLAEALAPPEPSPRDVLSVEKPSEKESSPSALMDQTYDSTANGGAVNNFIFDPSARDEFKKQQPGLRRGDDQKSYIQLTLSEPTEKLIERYAERRSHRQFAREPIALEELAAFLSCLRQLSHDRKPKYLYASAGGLYPVQIYLHIKSERAEGLSAGAYYYHPVDHRLILLSGDVDLDRNIHEPFINRPMFDQAAFSIFLIAKLSAITPMYGELSMHFATLEAGLMAQLMETTAPSSHIGLCQIGSLDFESIRHLFGLDENHVLVHSLLGGRISNHQGIGETPDSAKHEEVEKAAQILRRIKELTEEEVRELLEEEHGR